MVDTMPTSAADTSGSQAPPYEATSTPSVTAGSAASTGDTVFSGLSTPTGTLSSNSPKVWDTSKVLVHINGSPASQGVIKGGKKAPDITRLSDLVKLVHAVASNHPLDGFDPQVIQDVAREAKLSPQATAALVNASANDKTKSAVVETAWKGITTHLTNLGVDLKPYPGITQPPNAYNAVNKLAELGKVQLESSVHNSLEDQGFDVGGMKDVAALVGAHDTAQFAKGAPGGTIAIPATTDSQGKTTLAQQWDQFVSKWNSNDNNFRATTTQDLVAVGALDITGGSPTAQQVAEAQQNVMSVAADKGITVAAAMNSLQGAEPAGINGGNINKENIDQAYVMHQAEQILGPNSITPNQANVLANLASKAGTNAPAQDLIDQGLVSLYDENNPSTDGASYAGASYNFAEDALAAQGIPVTPQLVGNIVKQILATGVDTPYQLSTLATQAAEGYAKNNVKSLYGEGVSAGVDAGTSVQQQAQPYMQTASAILGTPTTEMQANDPTGQWMAWSHGGAGEGGVMTQQEWQQYLMTDPKYGYQKTQTAGAQEGGAATGILQLLGKVPSSTPSLPGAVISAGQAST